MQSCGKQEYPPDMDATLMLPPPLSISPPARHQLGSLACDSLVVEPNELTLRLEKRFRDDATLPVAVVLFRAQPIGIVERNYLFDLFAQPYGRALNERKPVVEIMQTATVLAASMPLLEAGRHLIENSAENDELPHSLIVVDDDNRYVGLVRVRELLRCLTELQIEHARDANPLTGLPGNLALARHVDHALAMQRPMHVAYIDCSHFKPYNDIYGYAAGDEIIRLVGRLLADHVSHEDFVAHIGGDDFMVVFHQHDWLPCCEAVLHHFSKQCERFYDAEDLAQGRFRGKDRQGNSCWFPLVSLAIGVCVPDPLYCRSHLEVSTLAADAKQEAKRIGGNVVYVSRRRRPSVWQDDRLGTPEDAAN